MENITTFRPAKRILALYFISFVILLTFLAFLLAQVPKEIPFNGIIINYVWVITTVLGFLLLCYLSLWRFTSVYTISTECVGASIGILSKKHIRIPLNKIVDYRVIKPLFERILGLGTIYIDTAGNEHLVMEQISKEEINLAIHNLDKLLHIEQYRSDSIAA